MNINILTVTTDIQNYHDICILKPNIWQNTPFCHAKCFARNSTYVFPRFPFPLTVEGFTTTPTLQLANCVEFPKIHICGPVDSVIIEHVDDTEG